MATISKRKSSPFWQVSWQENNRQRRQSTGVRHNNKRKPPEAVRRIAAAIEERIALNQFGIAPAWRSISVEQAIKDEATTLNLQVKLGKISDDRSLALQDEHKRLQPMLSKCGIVMLKDLTEETAAAFLELGISKWVAGTLKTRVGILAKLWQRHIDNGAPMKNHWKGQGIEANHAKKRSLTQQELDVLLAELANIPDTMPKREIQYLTMMGLFTGARVAMCQRLTESMVDYDKRLIQFPTVKKQEHTSHMHQQLYQFLMDYPTRADGHYIEPHRNWSSRYSYWVESKLRKNGLFEGFSHHCLRVTFNTLMLESGLPEQVTMEIIGHQSPEAHKRYKDIKAQKYSDDIESALSALKVR